MKMTQASSKQRRRALVRSITRLFIAGVICVALGPLYFWWCMNHSGELALKQTISAGEAARGFDFGPVYMRQGVSGRYFIEVDIPAGEEDYWLTSFEVLDSQLKPVYRQDEIRYIGEFPFATGGTDAYAKSFTPDRVSGYFYFRFTSDNGVYSAEQFNTPVVEFMVRQGVITGYALWLPAAGAPLLGLILLAIAVLQTGVLGRPVERRLSEEQYSSGRDDGAAYGG
jgi:hypothetical protein